MKEGKEFILIETDVLERYLQGTINKEDIQKLQDLIENQKSDPFSGICGLQIVPRKVQSVPDLLKNRNYFGIKK